MEIRRPFKFAWLRGDISYLFRMMIAHVNAPFMARSVGNAGREERTIEPLKASTGKDVAGAHGRFDPAESGSNHLMEHIGRQKWIFLTAYFLSWTFFF